MVRRMIVLGNEQAVIRSSRVPTPKAGGRERANGVAADLGLGASSRTAARST